MTTLKVCIYRLPLAAAWHRLYSSVCRSHESGRDAHRGMVMCWATYVGVHALYRHLGFMWKASAELWVDSARFRPIWFRPIWAEFGLDSTEVESSSTNVGPDLVKLARTSGKVGLPRPSLGRTGPNSVRLGAGCFRIRLASTVFGPESCNCFFRPRSSTEFV